MHLKPGYAIARRVTELALGQDLTSFGVDALVERGLLVRSEVRHLYDGHVGHVFESILVLDVASRR